MGFSKMNLGNEENIKILKNLGFKAAQGDAAAGTAYRMMKELERDDPEAHKIAYRAYILTLTGKINATQNADMWNTNKR